MDVSISMSTRLSSTAHHRMPMSSWYHCKPSAFNSGVTSNSGQYPQAKGVLHLDGSHCPIFCSISSMFCIADFTYFSEDMNHPSLHSTCIVPNCAPKYISGGSILSPLSLNCLCRDRKIDFVSSETDNISST